MNKLLMLAAGAAGYVLGTRAGRERYDQIRNQTQKVWNSPTVQDGVGHATDAAKTAASAGGSKVAETASTAASAARTKVSEMRSSDDDPASSASTLDASAGDDLDQPSTGTTGPGTSGPNPVTPATTQPPAGADETVGDDEPPAGTGPMGGTDEPPRVR